MKQNRSVLSRAVVVALFSLSIGASPALFAGGAGEAKVTAMPTGLTVAPPGVPNVIALTVRIAAPDDTVIELKSNGEALQWSAAGMPDGHYRYEAYVTTRAEGDESSETTILRGRLTILQGMIMDGRDASGGDDESTGALDNWREGAERIAGALLEFVVPAAQAADLLASSGIPTVRYRDTDLTHDVWLTRGLEDNADCSGTSFSRFDLWDMRGSNRVFSACSTSDDVPTHRSIVIDSAGDITLADDGFFFDRSAKRLGINTITPQRGIHVLATSSKSTMAIRMENTADATWDIGQDSAGDFFISLVDSQVSTAPKGERLTILDQNGFVGIGRTVPKAPLHVYRPSGSSDPAMVKVEDESGTAGGVETMFNLINNGPPAFRFRDNHNNQTWQFRGAQNGSFKIDDPSTGGNEMEIQPGGDLKIAGTLYQASSRELKEGIEALDAREVLEKVAALPVSEWSYKADGGKVRHVGPMAEDFRAVFGLGEDRRSISSIDTSGVALAAIQGLNQVVQEKDARIERLEAEIEEMKAQQERLARLEEMLRNLAGNGTVSME